MLETNSNEELDLKFLLISMTARTIKLRKKANIAMGKAEIKILLPTSKQMFSVSTRPMALRQRISWTMHFGKKWCFANSWFVLLKMYLCLTQPFCMIAPSFPSEISPTSWFLTRLQTVQWELSDTPLIIRRDLCLRMFSVIVQLVFPVTSRVVKDGIWWTMSPFHSRSLFSPMSL